MKKLFIIAVLILTSTFVSHAQKKYKPVKPPLELRGNFQILYWEIKYEGTDREYYYAGILFRRKCVGYITSRKAKNLESSIVRGKEVLLDNKDILIQKGTLSDIEISFFEKRRVHTYSISPEDVGQGVIIFKAGNYKVSISQNGVATLPWRKELDEK